MLTRSPANKKHYHTNWMEEIAVVPFKMFDGNLRATHRLQAHLARPCLNQLGVTPAFQLAMAFTHVPDTHEK